MHVLNCNSDIGMKTPSHVFIKFMGSLNQPSFLLNFLNLTHIATSTSSVEQILTSIHSPHAAASGLQALSLIRRQKELESINTLNELRPKSFGMSRDATFEYKLLIYFRSESRCIETGVGAWYTSCF